MAKIYCLRHSPEDIGYKHYVKPLEYLNLKCEHSSCQNQAVVWLNASELETYKQGRRLFWFNKEAIKVDNSGIYTKQTPMTQLKRFFRPQ